jgi:hypothetical protein
MVCYIWGILPSFYEDFLALVPFQLIKNTQTCKIILKNSNMAPLNFVKIVFLSFVLLNAPEAVLLPFLVSANNNIS